MKSRTVEEDVVSLEMAKRIYSEKDPGTGRKTLGQVKKILFGSINYGPTRGPGLRPGTDKETIHYKEFLDKA